MSPGSKQVQTNSVNGPDQHPCPARRSFRPRPALPPHCPRVARPDPPPDPPDPPACGQRGFVQGHLRRSGCGLPSGSYT
jgi:hypothetical protein